MGNKLSTASSIEPSSNSTSSNATTPLSDITVESSSTTTFDVSAANNTDVQTSVTSSISTSVVEVTTMSSSSSSVARTRVSSGHAVNATPSPSPTSSEPAASTVASTTPSTAVTSKATSTRSTTPVASPSAAAPNTSRPVASQSSPTAVNDQQSSVVSNDGSHASVAAHSSSESANAGGTGSAVTDAPPVTTSVASTPISITLSSNGHKIVTAPASITTTIASVSAGSTTFIPVIIANPIPAGSLNDQSDFSKPKGFLSNTPAVAAVFTVCGLFAVSLVLVLLIRARRKRVSRQRANASAIYTGNMIQRFEPPAWHGIVEPRMPSFEDIPRPPPIPPRRRPVPAYSFDSRGSNSSPPLSLGTAVYIPSEHSFRPDMSNPFADPTAHSSTHSSPIRELPLLHRSLKTPSNEGHQQSEDVFRPPSPAPSTPSLYPPTLPAFDDGFSLGPSRVTLHDDLETTSHLRSHENPFFDGPVSLPNHAS